MVGTSLDRLPDDWVLFLDNHLLVVNKPPGMLTQADETGDPDLLHLGKAYLKHRFDKPGKVFLGLVHRIDRPASGVLIFARTSKAAARLSDQFRRLKPKKTYLAVVEGEPPDVGDLTDFLEKRPDRRVVVVDESSPRGKKARLTYRVLVRRSGLSLLRVTLFTGRPHQIRVQFSSRGFPIVGDLRYGSTRVLSPESLALHSFQLEIQHPTKKDQHHFTADPPRTWDGLPFEPRDW